MASDRSRSPPAARNGSDRNALRRSLRTTPVGPAGVPASEDVAAAHKLREARAPGDAPAQSFFRVAAVLRFRRSDGSEGTFQGVNAEPCDANIRGAICAERAAYCRFAEAEEAAGSRIVRIVCVTDAPQAIFPGPLCREFLFASCSADTEVIASGTKDLADFTRCQIQELWPLPSVYCRGDQASMKALGSELGPKVQPPTDKGLAAAYAAAFEKAKRQKAQLGVFPVVFAAAVVFEDGRVHCTQELKGMEYGCSVDAGSLLLSELVRAREENTPPAIAMLQVDNFGIAHAPFAAARSLLVEHGFGTTLLHAHGASGEWQTPVTAKESLPAADFCEMF